MQKFHEFLAVLFGAWLLAYAALDFFFPSVAFWAVNLIGLALGLLLNGVYFDILPGTAAGAEDGDEDA